jgi:hypothetical protein
MNCRLRIAVERDVANEARTKHEVVVHDVAARALDGLDQPERRLLAERAHDDDAAVVARPLWIGLDVGQILSRARDELLGGNDLAGSQQEV